MTRTSTILLLWLCLCASLGASPPRYTVTDIGPADSGQRLFINNHGQVAASYSTGQPITDRTQVIPGFFWMRGQRTLLGQPRKYNSIIVCGINNCGQIAGSLDATFDNPLTIVRHAFLWQHGTMRDLGAPDGDKVSEARAINDKGEIVGRAYASGRPVEDDARLTEHHAFVYQNGQMTDLGLGEADAINNKGEIAGETPGSVHVNAALWIKEQVVSLGIFGSRNKL